MMVIKTISNTSISVRKQLMEPVHIAPLIVLRILFGAIMLVSIIRFVLKGWVYDLYVAPKFFFTFYGFEWVKPLGETAMYALFYMLAVASFFILLGAFYRWAALIFFVGFTYIELIDKSNYLNHYYFVSIISFLLILVPANKYFSFDAFRNPALKATHVPGWTILIFKIQLAIVYIYAGLAKINYDWLIEAQPLRLWLPAKSHLPVIGTLLDKVWIAYVFSWFGAVYDLFIVFFLNRKNTQYIAYFFVVVFHISTALLFQIGMFPYIMVIMSLIFFSESFHIRFLHKIKRLFKYSEDDFLNEKMKIIYTFAPAKRKMISGILILHFFFQFIFPFRHLMYPGDIFWTEEGYRFSWRVMLMEKAGTAFFYVTDSATGKKGEIINRDYLTKNQEKMMATQPDMILQYAHFLKNEYQKKGIADPVITVESYVSLNGKGSRLFIDDSVDLTKENEGLVAKKWILPLNNQ